MYIPDQATTYPLDSTSVEALTSKWCQKKLAQGYPFMIKARKRALRSTSMKKCPTRVRRYNRLTNQGTISIYSKVKGSSGSLMMMMQRLHRIKL